MSTIWCLLPRDTSETLPRRFRDAALQVSTIWSILLRDFELQMTTPLPKPAYNDMVVGPDAPIMMRYKRKVFLAPEEIAARQARYAAGAAAAKAEKEEAAAARLHGGGRAAGGGGGVQLTRAVSDSHYPRGPLLILWGSQTGTAASFGGLPSAQ